MFGIRLGEFGKGFVGGLAESANEALKTDIKNINTRIDDLAKIKFDRALKDQDERKKEVTEAEEILREAGAVFGDDPYAADYAAALLKETGSIDAFRQEIAKLRKAKDNNVPLAQFIQRASVDSPTGTFRDYANAYVNSSRTLPDLTTPVDTTSTGDLVGSILGKDIDIGGRVEKRVSEQMSAAGITPVTDAGAFVAPEISYNREGINLYQMTPTERITYWQREEARAGNTADRKAEITKNLTDNLAAAETDSNISTALSSLDIQLARIKGDDPESEKARDEINARKKPLLRQQEINAATPLGKKAVMLVEVAHLEQDGNMDEARKLRREAETLTGTTLEQLLAFQTEDAELAFSKFIKTNGEEGIDPDSEEGQALIQNNIVLKNSIAAVRGANALDGDDLQSASSKINNELNVVLTSASIDFPDLFMKDADGKPVFKPGMDDDQKAKARKIERDARTDIIDTLIANTTSEKEKAALGVKRKEYEAKGMVNPLPERDESGEIVTEPLVIGDTTVTADTLSTFASSIAGVKNEEDARDIITGIIETHNPNDINSATAFAEGIEANKIEEELAPLIATGAYSDEWLAAARKATEKPEVDTSVETDIDKAAQALQILAPSFMTGDRAYINAISTALKISKDEARKLLPEAKKAYAELKRGSIAQEDKRPDQLLADIRGAKTTDAYEAAVAAYADNQGRTVDDVKEQYPSKVATKAKGGLMSKVY